MQETGLSAAVEQLYTFHICAGYRSRWTGVPGRASLYAGGVDMGRRSAPPVAGARAVKMRRGAKGQSGPGPPPFEKMGVETRTASSSDAITLFGGGMSGVCR